MPTIAIIGAGFTGSMLAVHLMSQASANPLMRHASPPLRITLIEKRSRCGPGLAYSTDNPSHLLNGPAGKMSAFPSAPNHFLEWLSRHSQQGHSRSRFYGPGSFVTRQLYGDYLSSLLDHAAESSPPDRFQRITAQAIDLSAETDAIKIKLSDGATVSADRGVLALGNFPPLSSLDSAVIASDRYIADP
ncbi:MAG TPA: FAD/NAD(P)-binding protein, partial [Candidatus Binataceae bacterium]|nr:FAD/NAD(P)-binding protein [Candidatus Binataceae bacterium]